MRNLLVLFVLLVSILNVGCDSNCVCAQPPAAVASASSTAVESSEVSVEASLSVAGDAMTCEADSTAVNDSYSDVVKVDVRHD